MTLVLRGRVLDPNRKPRFRVGRMEIARPMYSDETDTYYTEGGRDFAFDETGFFRFEVASPADDEAFVGRLLMTDFDGRVYSDRRVLPPSGDVVWFECPKAVDGTWEPEAEETRTPIFVSDYNKPGGPLQLTNDGTISDKHIPSDFLRLDDPRMPELSAYLLKTDYERDFVQRLSQEFHFPDTQLAWLAIHNLPYRPAGVTTVQNDGTEIVGSVSYPGHQQVLVQWSVPTSGIMYLS